MSSAVSSSTLLHQFIHWSGIHGLLSVLAVCCCFFMDISSYEHNWKAFINIFHRWTILIWLILNHLFCILIGLGIGSLSSPPLAGWLFMLNPMYVMYSVGVMVFLQRLAVISMYVISNKRWIKFMKIVYEYFFLIQIPKNVWIWFLYSCNSLFLFYSQISHDY